MLYRIQQVQSGFGGTGYIGGGVGGGFGVGGALGLGTAIGGAGGVITPLPGSVGGGASIPSIRIRAAEQLRFLRLDNLNYLVKIKRALC